MEWYLCSTPGMTVYASSLEGSTCPHVSSSQMSGMIVRLMGSSGSLKSMSDR